MKRKQMHKKKRQKKVDDTDDNVVTLKLPQVLAQPWPGYSVFPEPHANCIFSVVFLFLKVT